MPAFIPPFQPGQVPSRTVRPLPLATQTVTPSNSFFFQRKKIFRPFDPLASLDSSVGKNVVATPAAPAATAALDAASPSVSSIPDQGSSGGSKAGAVIGSLILIAFIVLGVLFFIRRRKYRSPPASDFITVTPIHTLHRDSTISSTSTRLEDRPSSVVKDPVVVRDPF